MASLASPPLLNSDGQLSETCIPQAIHPPIPSSSSTPLNLHQPPHPPNFPSSSAALHPRFPLLDSPPDSKINRRDPMPSSSLPSSHLSRSNPSMVFELSDSEEERFLTGLEDQIQDVSMEPVAQAEPSTSRSSRAQPKKVHVIDLTRFDSPPSTSLRKRRLETSFPFADKDKKLKLAGRQADALHESTSAAPENPLKTSSSGLVLDLDDELSCPICCELFVSPVNFECGHAFCGSCAHAWLQKESVCPTCRRETHLNPARMYSMDATLQKYLNYQAEHLRQSDKASEALALELEYQERQTHWATQRKQLEAKASASRRAMTRFTSTRHPVALPHIHSFGPRLYSPYPREVVPHRAAHDRQPAVPPVEQIIRARERQAPVGWPQNRNFPIGPAYQLMAQHHQHHPVDGTTNRTASGSNNTHNRPPTDGANNQHLEMFDPVDQAAWDQLGPYFARS